MSASAIARCSLARGGGLQCLVRMSLCALVALCVVGELPVARAATIDGAAAARFAQLALDCVHREYPNKIAHVLESRCGREAAARAHSRVLRLLRLALGGARALAAGAAAQRFRMRRVRCAGARGARAQPHAAEHRDRSGVPARRGSRVVRATIWSRMAAAARRRTARARTIRRRANGRVHSRRSRAEAASRFKGWLPNLRYPIRIGEHDQTAFAFGLVWTGRSAPPTPTCSACCATRRSSSITGDRDCPLAYEPSGQDFLSPCLAEADFMRRVLEPAVYAKWLDAFMPGCRAMVRRAGCESLK